MNAILLLLLGLKSLTTHFTGFDSGFTGFRQNFVADILLSFAVQQMQNETRS
jgi:hypothetical protein